MIVIIETPIMKFKNLYITITAEIAEREYFKR